MSDSRKDSQAGGSAEFPALLEMGVTRPLEVSRYKLRQGDNEDVLKVNYRRKKGSMLPSSRKFRFGRSSRTIVTDSGQPKYAEDFEISTVLQSVIAELDKVVARNNDHDALKASLVDELDYLGNYVNSKLKELRSQVERL